MPRVARQAPGGIVYHALNRGVGRRRLFHKPADYEAFLRVLAETLELRPMRLLGFCVMPNHWHLLLWPRRDGELAAFMQRLTITHVRRWVEHRHEVGCGHVYQGRFKSFPVQSDPHYLTALRYVERNALRAGLVERAQDWRYGSLWLRTRRGERGLTREDLVLREAIAMQPIDLPDRWTTRVSRAETDTELEALRRSVRHGRPFGSERWSRQTADRLGLPATLRPRGRPRKERSP